jgi:paxillin
MGFGIWESKDGEENDGVAGYQVASKDIHVTSTTRTTTSRQSHTTMVPDSTSASTATAELDDLMTSLNNFKMDERSVDEPVIGGAPNLDDMLGNLQEDMNKQGVKTKQKGVCAACSKPIVGQVITALGHTWHPEHFTCTHCNQELGTQNFFEREGRPYCEQDYHGLFSPRCGYCQGPILDKCISALDQTFHPEHFFCSECGHQFGDDGFHEKDDAAFCKTCYFEQFAPKCGGCNTPITENYISSLNLQWHPNCFVCKECQMPFHDGNFFEHEGFPYCEQHYHALRGSLCAGCHKAISGRCITAMFRKFHPEHFVCSFCLKQLNKGTFKEQGEKPYCHECFDRLFG